MDFDDWRDQILSNQDTQIGLQEESLGLQEDAIRTAQLGNAINAAGHFMNYRAIKEVNASVQELNETVTDEFERTRDLISQGVDTITSTLDANAKIARTQAYAQWRDGTPNGRYFHNEYRPAALRYLTRFRRNCEVWQMLVLNAAREEMARFDEWKKPEWRSDALRTGVFLDPPRDPPRRPEMPAALHPAFDTRSAPSSTGGIILTLALCLFVPTFFVVMFIALYGPLTGQPVADEMGYVNTVYPPAGLTLLVWLVPLVAILLIRLPKIMRREGGRKNGIEERRAARARISQSMAEWDDAWARAQRDWKEWNERAKREAEVMICLRIGVDLSNSFDTLWASEGELARMRHVSRVLRECVENPPAPEELIALGDPERRADMPARYRDDFDRITGKLRDLR